MSPVSEAYSRLLSFGWDHALISILLLIGTYIFVHGFYNLYLHPLSSVPGPKHWAATPLFYTRCMKSGQYAQKLNILHQHYGPVIRVAPDELSFTSSDAWSAIFSGGISAGSFPKSTRWFQARPNGAYGILASPKTSHSRFRRAFAPAFTEKALLGREGLITGHTNALIHKLDGFEATNVNITDELEFTAFDIAGDFAFSEQFRCLESPENRNQIRIIQSALKEFSFRAMRRVLGIEMLRNLYNNALTSIKPRQTVYQKWLATWTRLRLETEGTEAGNQQREDLMTYVGRSTGPRKSLAPAEAENSLGDFMLAGTETIASTTVAALSFLLRDQKVMDELQAELRDQLPDSLPTDPTASSASDSGKLADLPLLNAVINESMRLAPTIPSVLAREVPSPGAHICGYRVPSGTYVSFAQYAAYRDPNNFSSPDSFQPRRWLDPTSFEPHNSAVFHPFSIGPRNCIGKTWGLMVVRALLAGILRRYRVRRVLNEGGDWSWEEQNAWFIWEKRDLLVTLEVRGGGMGSAGNDK